MIILRDGKTLKEIATYHPRFAAPPPKSRNLRTYVAGPQDSIYALQAVQVDHTEKPPIEMDYKLLFLQTEFIFFICF